MNNIFFLLGAIFGGLGVAFGAFGSHGLRNRASLELLATFETGVRYQIYHALALLVISITQAYHAGSILLSIAGWLFVTGIVVFSGSLYLLVLTGKRSFGAITPLGGLAFIAGWILLAVSFF